jgi:hypothetical protein
MDSENKEALAALMDEEVVITVAGLRRGKPLARRSI